MSASPFSHHDIVKLSAPLSRAGFKVNLSRSHRNDRYIEFEPLADNDTSTTVIHCLHPDQNDQLILVRVVVHSCGLVSTIRAAFSNPELALSKLNEIPVSSQISVSDHCAFAYSYALAIKAEHSAEPAIATSFICAHIAGLELRVDTSTSGGMPADVRLLLKDAASANLRETLADGSDLPLNHRAAHLLRHKAMDTVPAIADIKLSALPEDLLAVLGNQWRPLRFQGDHWKGVLRQLGKGRKREERCRVFVAEAVQHLKSTLHSEPSRYHNEQLRARWRVYFWRLQPLMVLLAILAAMPLSWLLVSSGSMSIHPLALGITPLSMVGAIVLTAREIPIIEIPPTPRELPATVWASLKNENNEHSAALKKQTIEST